MKRALVPSPSYERQHEFTAVENRSALELLIGLQPLIAELVGAVLGILVADNLPRAMLIMTRAI